MQRLALNCSPRGIESNSHRILEWIAEGVQNAGGTLQFRHLAVKNSTALADFLAADEIVMALPLYTDFVPGIVKDFLETVASHPDRLPGKRIAFIVHSGFPESIHSENTLAWLERMAARLGMRCVGAVIKGGSEGLRLMPAKMTLPTQTLFSTLGTNLVTMGQFDSASQKQLAGQRRFNPLLLAIFGLMPSALKNGYWNQNLRTHHAYAQRFARPYAQSRGK